uniref:Dynein regulatory complex subunit 4 n=1 Tax=Xiphophorus couchianus TaxID=32473 RepID=A0A3B5LXV1_9TELE
QPPKNRNKKSGKGKPSAVVDALSTEEMSKDQLEEHVVRLREELDREREERSYFQLERDKIRGLWEISRRRLEEAEAELRDGVRQRDEAAERHRVEITVYKQKLKHVLSEQHNAVCEMKTDAISSSSLLRDRNAGSELDLQRQLQDLSSSSPFFLLLCPASCRRLAASSPELEMSFHQRAHSLMQAEVRKRRAAVSEVEQRMKSHMESLMEEHDRVLRKGEEYFSRIQRNQQEELDSCSALMVLMMMMMMMVCEQEYRAQQKLVDQELRDLTVEHELLLQAFHKVQQERDELLRRQTQSILDVQQRSGLKKILLQRKMEALSQTLEKKEAQLSAALSVCSVEPTARSNAALKLQVRGRRAAPLGGTGTSPQVLIRNQCLRRCQEPGRSNPETEPRGPATAAGDSPSPQRTSPDSEPSAPPYRTPV